jgi:hypothetical protein
MALKCSFCGKHHNVGFVATRLAGTDGVSLETAKWADVFEREGFDCFYFAGELDRPPERSFLAGEAHFTHPEIRRIHNRCFNVKLRDRSITKKIYRMKRRLKDKLYQFIESCRIDMLVPENSLTIPLNLPLGIAIAEVICETGIPTIAHHHDFFWERKHFLRNAVWDFLSTWPFRRICPRYTMW